MDKEWEQAHPFELNTGKTIHYMDVNYIASDATGYANLPEKKCPSCGFQSTGGQYPYLVNFEPFVSTLYNGRDLNTSHVTHIDNMMSACSIQAHIVKI